MQVRVTIREKYPGERRTSLLAALDHVAEDLCKSTPREELSPMEHKVSEELRQQLVRYYSRLHSSLEQHILAILSEPPGVQ